MNLSEPSDDDSSSGECSPKRPRTNTYRTSSSTSHGSAVQESDEEPTETITNRPRLSYTEQSPHDSRCRSSLSENCSSPNDQYEDYRSGFEDDNGESSLCQNSQDTNDNTFYKKKSVQYGEIDNSIKGGYSGVAKKLMSKMGYVPGKGLGKLGEGRTEPVEAFSQKGRRGLGLKSIVGEIPQDFKWSSDDVKPEAKEEVSWMPPAPDETLSIDLLDEWLQKGPKKSTINDETEFVQPHILKGVLDAKTIFDSLDDEDLRHARFRSNPYETIGSVIFLNRAAVKMANLDAVFEFMFTKPKKQNGESAVDKKELLYFADVCAGPGGFSEYVLYRRSWKAKGFGFTLKGSNDFKLSDFYAGTPESFNPYYGVEDDGNIFNPANLMSLKDHVLTQTDRKGVHFLMADGGFSVEGQELIQEILSKQLYLCQCLAALMLVRTGGHFVVKLFDVFTMFSVGLIYIMYRCFDRVCIHKPVTSRPANSERYLVCMWKKLGTESAERHLFSVNSMLWEKRDEEDVMELVPLSVIQEDRGFYEYIYKSNCVLGERQIKNLLKIAQFSKDRSLKEPSQAEMREECLKLWQLPDRVRTQPERLGADDTLSTILSMMKKRPPGAHNLKTSVFNKPPEYLDNPSRLDTLKNVYDWHFMFLSSGKSTSDLTFFIGCGGNQVYKLDNGRWKNVTLPDMHFSLPAKTLFYGELISEFRGEGLKQMRTKALHVIDAIMLGGNDVSHLPLTERINQCSLFCAALDKPFANKTLTIRCKRLFDMERFSSVINNLEYRVMKQKGKAVTVIIPNRVTEVEMFHTVGSVLFIKELKAPWVAVMSKSSGRKYYFCTAKVQKPSEYFIPYEGRLDMISAFSCRNVWLWEENANAIFSGKSCQGTLSRTEMEDFIHRNIQR